MEGIICIKITSKMGQAILFALEIVRVLPRDGLQIHLVKRQRCAGKGIWIVLPRKGRAFKTGGAVMDTRVGAGRMKVMLCTGGKGALG